MVLTAQYSSFASIAAGVPLGSILGPLFFLIYIINLRKNLSSNPKLFVDYTSLFSVVHNLKTSKNNLTEDLKKFNDWATHWKMIFNPDPTKQAQEVIFSRKIKKPLQTLLKVNQSVYQRYYIVFPYIISLSIYSKPYIPVLLTVFNNISMKNVIK